MDGECPAVALEKTRALHLFVDGIFVDRGIRKDAFARRGGQSLPVGDKIPVGGLPGVLEGAACLIRDDLVAFIKQGKLRMRRQLADGPMDGKTAKAEDEQK